MIGLFVVDDHEMIRVGLRESLRTEPDIEIVGEAATLDDALAGILAASPDVALLDVRLGEESGVHLCREILGVDPSVHCLMFTSATGDGPLYESILAGASGYLLKEASRRELIDAIRTVAAGKSLIDPLMTNRVLARLRHEAQPPEAELTSQEERVLELIAEGLNNSEIADRMFLAEQTVKNYVSRVLTKLDMRRTQAALYAAGLRSKGRAQE